MDTKNIDALYIGNNPVDKLYIGSDLVWEKETTQYGWLYFDISPNATIIDQTGTHAAGYWPDGSIISIKNHDDDDFALYMSNRFAIRMTGSTPYPEDKLDQLVIGNRVFGEGVTPPIAGFTDDGIWFIGIHRTGGNNLIGFLHAESGYPGPQFDAYRNIGVTYSTNNGLTWSTPAKIIAPTYTKPAEAGHSGVGDGCVIYDPVSERFLCYYYAHENQKICLAASDTGGTGDWYKWDGTGFTVEAYNSSTGVGGIDTPVPGLESASGRNPNVMFNETFGRWVMVYGGWDGVVYMSSSEDAVYWEEPIRITGDQNGQALYPTLIGSRGSIVGNITMKLYHGKDTNPSTLTRDFARRDVEYTPVSPYDLPTPTTNMNVYTIVIGGADEYVQLTNVPDYVLAAEWRLGSPSSGIVSLSNVGVPIPSNLVPSPTSLVLYVRYIHHGFASEQHAVTIDFVDP